MLNHRFGGRLRLDDFIFLILARHHGILSGPRRKNHKQSRILRQISALPKNCEQGQSRSHKNEDNRKMDYRGVEGIWDIKHCTLPLTRIRHSCPKISTFLRLELRYCPISRTKNGVLAQLV